MLKAGRALLLFHGLRPAEGGQHKTVVDVTTALIGAQYRHLTDHFETMRRKRHEVTYEAGALVSLSEAAADRLNILEDDTDSPSFRQSGFRGRTAGPNELRSRRVAPG